MVVEKVVTPTEKDLGDFSVRRVLPSAGQRAIGPFVFFDHMGPAEFSPAEGVQVRPHPHIGLATITYLFEGEIIHRDSLGNSVAIQAGAINLMTAGRGIVHSERSGDDLNHRARLHGIQSWIALPSEMEECAPAFEHYPKQNLPAFQHQGCQINLIMGRAYGNQSPVNCYSPIVYMECNMPLGASLKLPDTESELAFYLVGGEIAVDKVNYQPFNLGVISPDSSVTLDAKSQSRVMVLGGDPLGNRYLWWNFVSTSQQRIEQAKLDWKQGKFDKVPGETEYTPLPD